MKKYITLAALLVAGSALANAAIDNTIWNFEDTLNSVSGEGYHVAAGLSYGQYVTEGETSTWGSVTPVYEDTGVEAGTSFGNYTLTTGLGKSLSFSDGCSLKVGDAHWGNSELKTGAAGTDFTIMAWVKFDSLSGAQAIFGTGDGSGAGITFGLIDGDKLNLCAKGVADNRTSRLNLSTNTWYNLAVSHDGDTGSASFYLNGELIQTSACGVSNGIGGSGSVIGSKGKDIKEDSFFGDIAQLQILNEALTQKDILKAASLIPEPSAFGLLAGLGALALVGARRRRR